MESLGIQRRSDLYHLKIVFGGAAIGAGPIDRHIFPPRPGRDALIGTTCGLLVDKAADETHVLLIAWITRLHDRLSLIHAHDEIPVVFTFAGSDPTGGAGLQADIEALASMGCHAAPIITAVTVQDTENVKGYSAVDANLVIAQARAVLEVLSVSAFKIGMLGSVENVEAVHTLLTDYPGIPFVLDPIILAGGGGVLADDDVVDALGGGGGPAGTRRT